MTRAAKSLVLLLAAWTAGFLLAVGLMACGPVKDDSGTDGKVDDRCGETSADCDGQSMGQGIERDGSGGPQPACPAALGALVQSMRHSDPGATPQPPRAADPTVAQGTTHVQHEAPATACGEAAGASSTTGA